MGLLYVEVAMSLASKRVACGVVDLTCGIP